MSLLRKWAQAMCLQQTKPSGFQLTPVKPNDEKIIRLNPTTGAYSLAPLLMVGLLLGGLQLD